jgi:chemotaxis regulatin CheY-phosphate phosphatase CheZ
LDTANSEDVMVSYSTAYQQLYNHMPKDLRAIDDEWILVNGARIQVSELRFLTQRLQQEYKQSQAHQRSIVTRLIKWFKG